MTTRAQPAALVERLVAARAGVDGREGLMRYTKHDEYFLRGLTKRRWPRESHEDEEAVSTGRSQISWTNLDHEGKQRARRLVAMGLLAVEDNMLVVVQPAEPWGEGLRVIVGGKP